MYLFEKFVPFVAYEEITWRSHSRFRSTPPTPSTSSKTSSGTRYLMFCDVSQQQRCKISSELLSSQSASCLQAFLCAAADDLIFQECYRSVFITHSCSRKWGRCWRAKKGSCPFQLSVCFAAGKGLSPFDSFLNGISLCLDTQMCVNRHKVCLGRR